jgi:hypothetical protein
MNSEQNPSRSKLASKKAGASTMKSKSGVTQAGASIAALESTMHTDPGAKEVVAAPASRNPSKPSKRDCKIQIWTLVAFRVLNHGNLGSYKEVWFMVQLTEVRHMERPLVINPWEQGFLPWAVEILQEARVFYPQSRKGGGEGQLVQTSPSNLKLAAEWKARGFKGEPKRGANDAYGSPDFLFHTLRVSTDPRADHKNYDRRGSKRALLYI